MTEPEQPQPTGDVPPRIELDPHPEPPPKSTYNPYQAPGAQSLEPAQQVWSDAHLEPVPWEDAQAMPGAIDRLWATIRLGFTDPMGLSARVPATDAILPSWVFFLIMGVPSLILNMVMSEMSSQFIASIFHTPVHRNPALQIAAVVASLLIGPFLGGAILHALLWMWGGTKNALGIEQTIRFSCYAQGVYYLVGWIPILNIPLGLAFWIFFSMGLAKVHRTDTWRGFAATLTPLLLLCCLGIGAAIMIPALIASRH